MEQNITYNTKAEGQHCAFVARFNYEKWNFVLLKFYMYHIYL